MTNTTDNVGALYKALRQKGFSDIGTEDIFRNKLQDENNRKQLYDALSKNGYDDIGDYDTFNTRVGSSYQSASPVQEVDSNYTAGQVDVGDMNGDVPEYLQRPEEQETIKGFVPAFKQGSDALYQGMKSSVSETANLLAGSSRDYTKAQRQLQELVDSGYDLTGFDKEKALKDYKDRQFQRDMDSWEEMMQQRRKEREGMGFLDALVHKFKDPDRPRDQYDSSAVAFNKMKVGDEVQLGRAFDAIQEALTQANGDVEKAYNLLGEQSAKETWGDKTSREAREAMREFKPTEGTAAWVGNIVPQMIGNVAGIAASVSPWTRWLARPLGVANLGMLTASSSGSAMADAREYAEQTGKQVSEGDVLRVGAISGAIEAGTEMLPYGRFFGGIHNSVAKKLGKEVTNAIAGNPTARRELSSLLRDAGSELSTKLFTKEAGKRFIGDVSIEGFSEFLAEGGGTLVPMIYQNPEDYPTLHEVLQNGWEGAKAGIFMGSILGGASSTIGHYQNRARRKQQGKMMLADTKDGVLEVVGQTGKDKYMAVDGEGMPHEITRDMVNDFEVVDFQEFDTYCKAQTEENLQKAVENGRSLAEDMDRTKKHAAKLELDKASRGLTPEMIEEMDGVSPTDYLASHEDVAEQVLPYLNAKAKYEGLIQGVREGIDGKIEQSNTYIDKNTHTDGRIYSARLKVDDEPVSIVSGDVALDENGLIDKERSAGRFIVMNSKGELQMRDRDDILSVDGISDAHEMKLTTAETIRQQEAQRAADEIEGKREFVQGEEVETYLNGMRMLVGVQAQNEDGTITVTDGKNEILTTREELQKGVDIVEQMRIDEELAAEQQGNDLASSDGMEDAYALNTELSFQTENGVVRGSVTNERNADGLIEVWTEEPLNGKKVNLFTEEELNRLLNPVSDIDPVNNEVLEEAKPLVEVSDSESAPVMEQIEQEEVVPTNDKGVKVWHEAKPETTFRELSFLLGNEEDVKETVAFTIEGLTKELEKLQTAKPKVSPDINAVIKDKADRKQKIDDVQAKLDYWNNVLRLTAKVEVEEVAASVTDVDMLEWTAENSTDLNEVVTAYNEAKELASHDIKLQPWEQALLGRKVSTDSFVRFSDKNHITGQLAKAWLRKDGVGIDQIQKEFEMEGLNVSEQDIVDFMLRHPSNYVRTTSDTQNSLGRRFSEIATKQAGMPIGGPESVTGKLFLQTLAQGKKLEGIQQAIEKQATQEDEVMEETFYQSIPDDALGTDEEIMHGVLDGVEYIDGEYVFNDAKMTTEEIDDIYSELELSNYGRETETENSQEDGITNPFDEAKEIEEPRTQGVAAEEDRETETRNSGTGIKNAFSYDKIVEIQEGNQVDEYDRLHGTQIGEMLNAIDAIQSNDTERKQKYYQRHFRINKTSDFLKTIGVKGDYFTVRTGVISRHINKDGSHGLGLEEWKDVAMSLSSPFAVTKYDKKDNAFRIWTNAKINNSYIVVGVDVKVSGKDMFVNSISTAFGLDNTGVSKDKIVWYDEKNINPAQRSVLNGLNSQIYPEAQGLFYENKDSEFQEEKQISSQETIAKAEQEVDASPSEAQKEAGNYRKGHVKIDGFDITIENPKGSVRSGVDGDGKPWSVTMNNTYGYIRGTEGVDGDHIDIFLGEHMEAPNVYVVDQVKQDGSFDEHKVMYGFNSALAAKRAYLKNYSAGWKGLGNITGVSKEVFREWIDSSHRKTKPFNEYKSVRDAVQSEVTQRAEQTEAVVASNESESKDAGIFTVEDVNAIKNNPLTVEEIESAAVEPELKTLAKDYLAGNESFINLVAYQNIYNDVRNRTRGIEPNSTGASETQLDEVINGNQGGLESGFGRGEVDNVGADGSETPVSRRGRSGKTGTEQPTLFDGERSDHEVRGEEPAVDGVSPGRGYSDGSGSAGGNGRDVSRPARGKTGSRGTKNDTGRRTNAGHERVDAVDKSSVSVDADLQSALDDFKDILHQFGKAGKNDMSLSLVGLNKEQIQLLPRLVSSGVKLGYQLIRKEVYDFKKWAEQMRSFIGDPLKQAIGYSDTDVNAFIREMWNSKFEIDGEVHTLAEWSAKLGTKELKRQVSATLEEKRAQQMAAESIPVKIADAQNIDETLPYLLPQQREDVRLAEVQFFDESHQDREHGHGKGYLFTNGTGTGKTYTGLGIVKRFIKQGKNRILVVTPSQPKVTDWMKDATNLGIELRDLDTLSKEKGTTATTEKGEGAVITTFANLRQNKALLEDTFDLIVYDESHRIMENKQGEATIGADVHFMITNRNTNDALRRYSVINPKYQAWQKAQELYKKEMESSRLLMQHAGDNEIGAKGDDYAKRLEDAKAAMQSAEKEWEEEEKRLKPLVDNAVKTTKTVFLSATPFNTRESLSYTEGYIFSYPKENTNTVGSYHHHSPQTEFYLTHFGAGYKFRYGRLERGLTNADALVKQEIAFSDYLENELGTKSGRIIDSEYDYSRDFPMVTLKRAQDINDAIECVWREDALSPLSDALRQVWFNYNYTSALLETMKISATIPRIREHLKMGRKVVVFHRRVQSKAALNPPFKTMLSIAREQMRSESNAEAKKKLQDAITLFEKRHEGLLQYEQTLDYSMPREQIAEAFGAENVLFFSGKESGKTKNKAVETFNDDDSGKNIIVIQEASGKEGISLHDTSGKHQRVLITLALPQSPITALQIEGRIYRIGNKSNAIFEYPLLGLDSEMILFGQQFNQQVSTTENLALGSKARDLRSSFTRGVEEHTNVPLEQQGFGGKEFDKGKMEMADPFEDAVLDYYGNQKVKGRRDNREGMDYFATPEPVGFKMVEWAMPQEGETALEPSAGHGAIARYVSRDVSLTAIEPSSSLFGKLQLKAGGMGRKFVNDLFENYAVQNKHDVIVMNPPFGAAGKKAMDHLEKAFDHLTEGGRVVALIPHGQMDKRFEKWYGEKKEAVVTAEINLPSCTFEQAGTSVYARIVVIDRIGREETRRKAPYRRNIDLSGIKTVKELFERLKDVEVPGRTIDEVARNMKNAKKTVKEFKEIKGVDVVVDTDGVFAYNRSGMTLFSQRFDSESMANIPNEYARMHYWIEANGTVDMGNRTKERIEVYVTGMKTLRNLTGKTHEQLMEESKDGKSVLPAENTMRTGATSEQQRSGDKYSYKEDRNTKTGEVMHLTIPLSKDLDRGLYLQMVACAKRNDGYWNRFKKAFHFQTKEGADRFIKESATIGEDGNMRFRLPDSDGVKGNQAVEQAEIRVEVEELADTLHTPIRIVRDTDEISDGNKGLEKRKKQSKGWFDSETGEVVLVLPNAKSVEDARATVFHEVVAHKGLRGLLGKEFAPFLDRTYKDLSESVRREVVELSKKHGWDLRVGMEEYMARLAERGFADRESSSVWNKIKNAFMDAVHRLKIELGFRLRDNDLRYILWKSYQNLKGGNGIMEQAEDIAFQMELGVGRFRKEDPKDVRLDLLRKSKPVEITGDEIPYSEDIKQYKKNALEYGKSLRGEYINKDTGASVFIGKNGIKEVLNHDYKNVEQLQSIAAIPEIIESSIFMSSQPNTDTKINADRFDYYICGLKIGGKDYTVRAVFVTPKDGTRYYDHKLTKIEKGKLLDSLIGITTPGFNQITSLDSEYKDIKLISILQNKEDNSLLNESEPRNVVNESTEGNKENIRFRDGDSSSGEAMREYEGAVKTNLYKFQEAYQDSMLGLLKLQESVVNETKTDLADNENAYMAENQLSSKNAYEMEFYKDRFFKPMMDAVKGFIKHGRSYEDVKEYMMAKSGLERNEVFAMRDAQRKMDERMKELETLLDINAISEEEYEEMRVMAEEQRDLDYAENRERDYSGLSSLMADTEQYEEMAQELVDNFEEGNEKAVAELWKRVNDATKSTLLKTYKSGMMTKGVYDHVKGMFEYYIPMRGWTEDVAADVYDYILSERSPFNAPVKAAQGRTSLADDPLATIGNMAESAIMQGNRNMMKQKFLNLVENHPTSLATVQKVWYENMGTKEEPVWEQSFPDIPENANADEVAVAIEEHEARMKELKKNGMAKDERNGVNLKYRASKREMNEHIVVVKRGGREYAVYVNGNPRAAQAINGLTNPDTIEHKGVKLVQRLNRQLAANFTTRNPAFVLSNLSRDLIFSTTAVAVKEKGKYARRFNANIAKNTLGMVKLMKRYQDGKLDMGKERDRLFKEFLENGGETGYTALHSVDEYKKLIDREVMDAKGKVDLGRVFGLKPGKVTTSTTLGIVPAFQFMSKWTEFGNRCAEDVSRFTAYMTSRQEGRSVQRSIADAKEITVNFNKKGAGGYGATTFKSLYLFFNAGVQSLNNFYRLAKGNPKKFNSALLGFTAAGVLLPMLNEFLIDMWGDDDDKDKYDNLPEWVRRNNFCFWLGDDRFVTIPLPIELRAFYGMGEIFNQWTKGNMKHKNVGYELVNQITELIPLNPLGGNGDVVSSFVPDAGKPFYQVMTNKDYFGKPIYKETDFNVLMPEFTKAYKGTSSALVASSELLNEVTGGDKYTRGWANVNPAKVEHIFEGYFGGMGKTINQLGKTIGMIWDEDQRVMRNVPVVNRFLNGTDDRNAFSRVNEEYYHYLEEFRETEQRLKGYEKEADLGIMEYAEKVNFLEYSKEYQRYEIFKDYQKELKELQTEIKEAVDKDERRFLENQLNFVKMELVERLNEMED